MQSNARYTKEQQVLVVQPKIVSKYIPKENNMNQDKGRIMDMNVGLFKDTT